MRTLREAAVRHLLHALALPVLLSGCATAYDTSLRHEPTKEHVRPYDAPVPTQEDQATIYLFAGCNFCPVVAFHNRDTWVLATLEGTKLKHVYEDHRWPGEQLLKLVPPKGLSSWHPHYKKHGIVWRS